MERSTHQKILRLTGVAVFAALSFVLTRFAAIPYAGGAGYFNFGDVVTFFVAMAYGPVEGALVGIIGGTMSDLTAGYAAFAPWTLMAKGVMGLLTGLLYIVLKNHKIVRFVSPFIGKKLDNLFQVFFSLVGPSLLTAPKETPVYSGFPKMLYYPCTNSALLLSTE
jgi:uncharacterized membrane protein